MLGTAALARYSLTDPVTGALVTNFVDIADGEQSVRVRVTAIDNDIFDGHALDTIMMRLDGTDNVNVSLDGNNRIAAIGILDNEPVIIDLDGDGVEFAANPVAFDIDDDGVDEMVAWAGRDDGFLAYDQDGSGTVNSRGEIVFTEHASGAETDLEAIRQAFDSNGDGLLTEADAEWEKIRNLAG